MKHVIHLGAKEVVTTQTRAMILEISHLDKDSNNDDISTEQMRRGTLKKPMGNETMTWN